MRVHAASTSLALAALLSAPLLAHAQVAGATVLGVTETVSAAIAKGWSVKRSILGQNVYNTDAKPAVVGKVEDVIIDPDGALSYAVVNASKFLGISSHLVLIPVQQFKIEGQRISLPGATKDALRAVPTFTYAPRAMKNMQ